MAQRVVLVLRDTDRENEYRPLRQKNGRLLVRLVSDPDSDDVGVPAGRTVNPSDQTMVLETSSLAMCNFTPAQMRIH